MYRSLESRPRHCRHHSLVLGAVVTCTVPNECCNFRIKTATESRDMRQHGWVLPETLQSHFIINPELILAITYSETFFRCQSCLLSFTISTFSYPVVLSSLRIWILGWRNDSVHEVPAIQAWGPMKNKSSMWLLACTCGLRRTGWGHREGSRPQKLTELSIQRETRYQP